MTLFVSMVMVLAPVTALGQTCPDPAALIKGVDGIMAHVRYLSDDLLEGRAVGTPGAHCAADYIAAQFEAIGLEPAGNQDNYFHAFKVRTGTELGSANRLVVDGIAMEVASEWVPSGFSSSADVETRLIHGGYGLSNLSSPDEDRYFQADITGRVVVLEWGDPAAPHSGGVRADPHFKATVSAGRGAAGVIVLAPDGMRLPSMDSEIRSALGVPVVVVEGRSAGLVRSAARKGAPVRMSIDVRPRLAEARNVAGVVRGSDLRFREEYVIIGAHFDHLGYGGQGSLAPDLRDVHNGADDNASGTAAIIEVARLMTENPSRRSVVFLAFTGEERGLWGSARWVEDPTISMSDAVAMLNLDMVGRVVDDAVTIFGFGTAREWGGIVDGANASLEVPLRVARAPDGYGPSDHSSFHAAGLPVLHFFSNTHVDYHRPSDDWDKINEDGLDRITSLAERVARRLAMGGADAVSLTPIQMEQPLTNGGGDISSAPPVGEGYGPYLGSIPDMSPREGGLRLTGVREGSPADMGGLRAGDVVLVFDGAEIGDIYAYTYALRAKSPGDEVVIVVERDGERITLTVTLGYRR